MWLLLVVLIAADTPPDERWATRVENNAVRAREAATALSETAGTISRSGRAEQLAPLRSDVDELVRRADVLARLAGSDAAP